LTLNAKIQAAADVRLFIVDPQAAEAGMKIGDNVSLDAARASCSPAAAWVSALHLLAI
jgi:hypothetical protein